MAACTRLATSLRVSIRVAIAVKWVPDRIQFEPRTGTYISGVTLPPAAEQRRAEYSQSSRCQAYLL